jgi:hypothetical protein
MPAPTEAMAWCHRTRSIAKNTPAPMASSRSWRVRGPYRRSSRSISSASTGSAYRHRNTAAVAGSTSARRTSVAELAMQAAPAAAARVGRAVRTPGDTCASRLWSGPFLGYAPVGATP